MVFRVFCPEMPFADVVNVFESEGYSAEDADKFYNSKVADVKDCFPFNDNLFW